MSGERSYEPLGAEGIELLSGLWNELFQHHCAIGAAGLPTIALSESWPRRRRHYESLFREHPHTRIWLARCGDERLGYALAYEDRLAGRRAMVLETLSVSGVSRGMGIGSELMAAADAWAREVGSECSVVDVMGGNERARALYLRSGHAPHSESWMRSVRPKHSKVSPDGAAGAARDTALLAEDRATFARMAASLGFTFDTSPGPDDTWDSADTLIELSLRETFPAGVAAQFHELTHLLAAHGFWTIRCEIPAAPREGALRELLRAEGYRLATERLVKPCDSSCRVAHPS